MDVSEAELQSLYTWEGVVVARGDAPAACLQVDEIPLSRPKRNINRDFSDGVLMAEVVHHFFPRIVELHNYSSANGATQKMYNWNTLNQKVLKRMGFALSKDDMTAMCNCQPGAVERVLKLFKVKIAKCTDEGFIAGVVMAGCLKTNADASHRQTSAPEADRGQMITIVSAYSPTEAASDEEAGDFYLRVAALADKANDKRDLLIVAGGSQRRAWDSSQLRRPAVRREFNLQLSDRFGLLEAVPPEGADAQAEYDAMAAAIREVATNHLAPRGSRRRRGWQFTLSQRTLRLMDARQRAHTAWLRSKSAAAKRERNRANRAADAAVQRDRERWIGQQVAEAQDMLRKKNLRQFARACDRLAGRSRSHQIPPAMRDVSGALHSGPDGVLKAMTESFDKLYGGETKLSDETLNQLENDVAAFELTRATEVDEAHGRPPDLAETEACVRALRSAAAPGGDQLDAMLLRTLVDEPSQAKLPAKHSYPSAAAPQPRVATKQHVGAPHSAMVQHAAPPAMSIASRMHGQPDESGELRETITELKETNEILETKVRKLEQLVRLKDAKIQTLMAKLQAGGLA
ncbi:hypothetical protein FOA52_001469 [Chlamydomonas sp. UWO 241]|nr:hypothetical protein FOA52_001469 [Chlamydomonas sp. UWO 241]